MQVFYLNTNCQVRYVEGVNNLDGTISFPIEEEHFLLGILKDSQIYTTDKFSESEQFGVKYKDMDMIKIMSQTKTQYPSRNLTIREEDLRLDCCGGDDDTTTEPVIMNLQQVTEEGKETTEGVTINKPGLLNIAGIDIQEISGENGSILDISPAELNVISRDFNLQAGRNALSFAGVNGFSFSVGNGRLRVISSTPNRQFTIDLNRGTTTLPILTALPDNPQPGEIAMYKQGTNPTRFIYANEGGWNFT